MATPKKNTKAPEAATVAEGEGVKAPVVVVETGAKAGEQSSSAPNTDEAADAIIKVAASPTSEAVVTATSESSFEATEDNVLASMTQPLLTDLVLITEIDVVEVIGPDAGRWRMTGNPRKFGPERMIIPLAELTADDLAELLGDAELKVQRLTIPAESI